LLSLKAGAHALAASSATHTPQAVRGQL